MSISGLGPHGERAASGDLLTLSCKDEEAARAGHFSVAVVMHTTTSDWSRQILAGVVTALGNYSAVVVDVVDCKFGIENQIQALNRLADEPVDAVISIPIGNAAVAEAHKRIARAGKKLILLDNAATGLLPGNDYVSVVSADNFGLGEVGAELLSPYLPEGGTVGILGYRVDFFATNQREIAFRKWIGANRPDLTLKMEKFHDVTNIESALERLLESCKPLSGLFVVWDEPTIAVVHHLRKRGLYLPITTVDLGNEAAAELARDGMIKGIGAQNPYRQGIAIAKTTVLSLLGHQPPPWIALHALAVTASNVIEAYQVVWHKPAPKDLIDIRRKNSKR